MRRRRPSLANSVATEPAFDKFGYMLGQLHPLQPFRQLAIDLDSVGAGFGALTHDDAVDQECER